MATVFCQSHTTEDAAAVPPYKPDSQAFYDTIAHLDSIYFDAYNTCKPAVADSLTADDIEFYHDRGGLETSKPKLVEAIKNNICNKVRRELLKGSIEVYSIPGSGAIEMGIHRFHNLVENSTSHYSKFVITWRKTNGKWQMSRVISLH